MKQLSKYINETLKQSQSDHINEWKLSSSDNIKINDSIDISFKYQLDHSYYLRIFAHNWKLVNQYKDSVYINGKHVLLSDEIGYIGYTKGLFDPGTYIVQIRGLNEIDIVSNMFWGCDIMYCPSFNIQNAKSTENMFRGCDNLIRIESFNTINVKSMESMFSSCDNMISAPNFDTINVENMKQMFWGCKNLKEVPLFDTRKVKDMDNMFWGCNNLSEETKQEWSQVYDFEKHEMKK